MKKKIVYIAKRVIQNELISGSTFIFAASMFSNVVGFLLNVFLTRSVTPNVYGEYQALLSLVGLFIIPAQSMTPVIVRFASKYISKNENNLAAFLYKRATVLVLGIALCIVIIFTIFSPLIAQFLHIHTQYLVIISGLLVCMAYVGVVNAGFLQSMIRFGFLSFTTSLGAFVKIVAGVGFVLLGFQTGGILFAIFLSLLIPYLLSFIPLKKLIFFAHTTIVRLELKEIGKYALVATVTLFSLSSFISSDILLVKHFFSSHDAGIYAGLSVVAKVIFYFTGVIPSVMFPVLTRRHFAGRNVHSIFALSMLLILIPSITLTIGYILFPHFFITFFLGGKGYLLGSSVLGLFGLFITAYSLVNILTNFFLSLNKVFIMYVTGFGALLQVLLISLFHKNFTQVVSDSLFVMLVMLIGLLLYYCKLYAKAEFFKKIFSFAYYPRV